MWRQSSYTNHFERVTQWKDQLKVCYDHGRVTEPVTSDDIIHTAIANTSFAGSKRYIWVEFEAADDDEKLAMIMDGACKERGVGMTIRKLWKKRFVWRSTILRSVSVNFFVCLFFLNSASWGAIPSACFVRCTCALKCNNYIIYNIYSHVHACQWISIHHMSMISECLTLYHRCIYDCIMHYSPVLDHVLLYHVLLWIYWEIRRSTAKPSLAS